MEKLQDVKTAPIGFCVYCNADGREETLTDEHIVRYGLDGWMVLAKASCCACARVTGSIEQYVLRGLLGQVRAKIGMRTRRPNQRPKTLPIIANHNGIQTEHQLQIADHPTPVQLPIFGRVPFLNGTVGSRWVQLVPPHFWKAMDHDAAAALSDMENPRTTLHFDAATFSLFLAKVAHCATVLNVGYGQFEPFLPRLIIERSVSIHDYVGGTEDPPDANRAPNTHVIVRSGGANDLIHVYVSVLAHLGAPYYEIIAGRRRIT